MTGLELSKILSEPKNASHVVLVRVVDDYCEVIGVKGTGRHRNAIVLDAIIPGLGGVIVVPPDTDDPPTEATK